MKITVLLIEDDPDISALYITRLKAADYAVMHVSNGEDVVPLVSKKTKPDVILLDLMLPGISGFEVVEKLRATSWKSIPIIVLTAFADTQREEEARKMGVAAYYLKTDISPGELVEVIKKTVER